MVDTDARRVQAPSGRQARRVLAHMRCQACLVLAHMGYQARRVLVRIGCQIDRVRVARRGRHTLGSMGWQIGRALVLVACLQGLAACSVTGHSFDSSGLNRLVPGQTTLAQASEAMNSAPVQQWPQPDGGLLARWAYARSLSTDAIYLRQAILLRFGPDGRFQAIEDTVNIPLVPSMQTLAQRARTAQDDARRARAAQDQAWGAALPPQSVQEGARRVAPPSPPAYGTWPVAGPQIELEEIIIGQPGGRARGPSPHSPD
ncbi:hypothetical protein [Castellaniella sp.]|uniref:hypothetical protein n=1 Tax=Castellaniella sp. TaxID=1955812 RepID=UPI0035687296